jgi:DNA-binding transcriptional LysR family regulator
VQENVAAGRLVRVLADWSPLLTGYHLYYPNRQPSPALALLVKALRYRS